VLFEPQEGELLLTRRQTLLGNENVRSSIIMVTTYTQSRKSIRFNTRLLHAGSNEVLAMSSQTIPLNSEMRTLAASSSGKSGVPVTGIMPSVGTRLP